MISYLGMKYIPVPLHQTVCYLRQVSYASFVFLFWYRVLVGNRHGGLWFGHVYTQFG